MALLVFLEPLDTCFFRDARSFGVDESTFAASGIPNGLTLYGALGSFILAEHEVSVSDFAAGKVPDDIRRKLGVYSSDLQDTVMRLQGPLLAAPSIDGQLQPYFSVPANLMTVRGRLRGRPYLALPADEHYMDGKKWDLDESIPGVRALRFPDPGDSALKLQQTAGYLCTRLLNQFLDGRLNTMAGGNAREESDFFLRENRTGNHVDRSSRTVTEGYLFATQHLRFKDALAGNRYAKAGLAVTIEGPEAGDLQDGIVFLGGERRRARLSCLALNDRLIPRSSHVIESISQKKRFFIYLATPAVFRNGWHRIPWPFDQNAVLVGAAVNKPARLSGWQRGGTGAGGRPRSFYRAAPAGSVYFFEAPSWTKDQFRAMYDRFHCSESVSEVYPAAGFGVALIGTW